MSYRVYEESDELENAGEGKEDSVFFPATADCPCNQLPYTLELKYTNAPPTECTTATGDGRVGGASNSVSIPRFLGVAHISTSLESDGQATLRALGISTAALPPVLRSTQKVPLTLLLTVQGRVQVLIGAQAVQEVPLAWQDDLAELSDAIASAPDAQSVIAMQTIHASGTHFVVHSQVCGSYSELWSCNNIIFYLLFCAESNVI